jgi:hypothetical protein
MIKLRFVCRVLAAKMPRRYDRLGNKAGYMYGSGSPSSFMHFFTFVVH